MKKIFTRNWFLMMWVLALGVVMPARAQTYTSKVLGTNLGISAVCKDASGNVYTVQTVSTAQNATQQNAQIVMYAAGTTTPTVLTGTTFQYSEYESVANYAFGLAVDGNGNIFVTTYNDYFPSDGRDVTTYGKILKMAPAGGNAYNQTTWVTGQYPSGNKIGDFGALAIDSHNNLFVDTYNDVDGKYEIVEYPSGSTTPSVIYTHLGDPELASGDHYSAFFALAFDSSDNLYAGTSFDTDNNSDGGKILQLTKASNYATVNTILSGGYCSALAVDANDRLYASLANFVNGTGLTSSRIVKFASDFSSNTTIHTGLSHDGSYEPWGLAVPNSSMIFAGIGGGPVDGTGHLGDLAVIFSTPSTQASNVNFTSIGATSATVNWTNGNGSARAVFVKNTNTGQPAPVNSTTYAANTNFGSGTQIGVTGWYTVYNGTGATSVGITGLTAGQNYQVMVVEYNGAAGSENYLQTAGTNNPNTFTAVSPVTISSLNRTDGAVNNLATVHYNLVFSSAVTGVTASNFALAGGSIGSASIGTPTTSDNITWAVPVSTGTGDGAIQLNFANATGLSKPVSTSLPFSGQLYTIDKTAPTISIDNPTVSITNGGPVSYTVTYADANFNSSTLSAGNIILNSTGTATASSIVVSGSGTTRSVTISGITGDGTLGISIAAGTATDLAGNSAPAAGPSTTFTVDNTAPTVAITRSDPNPIKDNVLDFQAVFSEPVTGVTGASFVMTNSGVTTGAISATMIDSKTYNVTVATVVGTGTARLDLVAGGATDASGNQAAAASGGTSATYDVDQTAPTATAISAASANPTNATSVDYTVTFSEPVTGVDALDFTRTTLSGNATGTVSSVSGSGATYTVTLTGVGGNGTLRLDLNASGTGIQDLAGNPISGGFATGDVYSIDNTVPQVTSGSYFSNNGFSSQYAKVGDQINLFIGFDGALVNPTMTIGGNPVTITGSNGNKNWSGSITMTSSDTEGNVPWTFDATDQAGNHRLYSNTDFGTFLVFDKTPPVPVIGAPVPAIAGDGAGNPVTYSVTYNDANFNFSTLSTSDITLNTTGTATGTIGLSGSGTSYTVTISGITGRGTLGISIGAGTAQDIPGNIAVASNPSATFNVVSADATLAALTTDLRKVAPNFNPAVTTGYTTIVPYAATSTAVIATPVESGATLQVRVNGGSYAAAPNGAASPALALNPGANTIDVLVTAPDQATTKTYTITTTRQNSSFLTALNYSPPSLRKTKVSGPDFVDYVATVDANVTSVSVTPIAEDPTAIITVNGETVTSGNASSPITLINGQNTIATVVTASDHSSTRTYSIVVTRQADALLSSLLYNPGLTAHKATGTHDFDYTATIYSSSVKVIPTADDPSATITVNGTAVTSGSESQPIALDLGPNTITTVVTASDGVTTKTYSMVVTRQPNAFLSMLSYSPPSLRKVKVSGPDYVDYVATVDYHVTETAVTPTVQDPTSTVTVNGVPVASGTASDPIALMVGQNTINTVVTAADGTTTNTYSIVITRQVDANLSSLVFNPGVTLQRVSGSHDVDYIGIINNSSVTVTPTVEDPAATVTVNGTPVTSGSPSAMIALTLGDNTITTVVTASDGTTTKTYSTVLTRQANALLASLNLSPVSIRKTKVSGPDYADYTASVANGINSVTVTPTAQDPTSTITVNGSPVASGAASNSIALAVGDNTITTVITAEDGTTTNSYVIVINRAMGSAVMAYQDPKESPINSDAIVVHQNVSPNGDGRGDAMMIDGITNYPDNKLQIMSRSGNLVYEAKGYDNTTKVFDGHNNDGKLQPAGTYFYSLEYKVGSETKHKTGYIVLKY